MTYGGSGLFLKVYVGWLVGKCVVIHEKPLKKKNKKKFGTELYCDESISTNLEVM